VNIKPNAIIDSGGGVQWHYKYLAVGAYIGSTPVIYQFSIHGSRGTRVGTTTLGSPAYLTSFQFFIRGSTVIVPNWYFVNSSEKKDVLFYKYPLGGSPTMILTKDVSDPRGVVVSLAPK
jgi:hypothetical protein